MRNIRYWAMLSVMILYACISHWLLDIFHVVVENRDDPVLYIVPIVFSLGLPGMVFLFYWDEKRFQK